VALATVTPVAAVPPKVTVAPDTNPEPVIVTGVPPAIGPDDGDTPVMAIEPYVNPLVSVAVPLLSVTTTLTAPAAWAGVVAVMLVALTTVTPVAAVPPKVTVAPETNPVPEIVTGVPPAAGPDAGEIDEMVTGLT